MQNRILLYYFSIKELRFKQIFYRIYYALYKPILSKKYKIEVNQNINSKLYFLKKKNSFYLPNNFIFLNQKQQFSKNIDWNIYKMSDLWKYNLNYFDYINQKDIKKNNKVKLINQWIEGNKEIDNIGWDPYPTSLRIVNWVKFFLSENYKDIYILENLYKQLRWLNRRIEFHLQANHLLSNLKAIIFGSTLFNGKESNYWFENACNHLEREIDIQILNDGGHFELSPMYHSIVLEDILDIINILKKYHFRKKNKLIKKLNKKVKKMIYWLEVMSHNKTSISFFNDTCDEIAPTLVDLKFYAKKIGIKLIKIKNKKIIFLKDSGYAILHENHFKLIIDIGNVGADIQPGHGHADALSFETSIKGNKFIVNSGISTYDETKERLFQRSTAAHSTIEINKSNSSEVWKSFRVARRAIVFNIKYSKGRNYQKISASHQGYTRFSRNLVHTREWKLSKNSFTIYDEISGKYKSAISRLYFHPEVIITSDDKIVVNNECKINVSTKCKSRIVSSHYYPEFNKKVLNKCLRTPIDGNNNKIQFNW